MNVMAPREPAQGKEIQLCAFNRESYGFGIFCFRRAFACGHHATSNQH
jgi:hypothetical protein